MIAKTAYKLLSPKQINAIGSSKLLKPIRDILLRKGRNFRVITVKVIRSYDRKKFEFSFNAPIKTAVKAQKKGIENSILRSTLKLMEDKNISQPKILDVGGNFGYLSLIWSLAFSDGEVHYVEPSALISKVFNKSVESNKLTNIHIHQNAVGKTLGTVKMFDSQVTTNINKDHLKTDDSFEVKMSTIDEFYKLFGDFDLVKIDVDGIEYDILQGGLTSLKRVKPILVIETNNDNRIISMLKSLDYSFFDVRLNKVDENLPENLICVPK